jgi:uncharacterized protein (DUF2252 family)
VQACGDAHLCNFGAFGTPERRLIFDVNDFDETLPAPWEWDVKRLAASVVVAARERGLTRAQADEAVLSCAARYRETMTASLELTLLDVWYRRVDAEDFEAQATREARRFAVRAFEKARRRTSQRELEKLTVLVEGQRRLQEFAPLIFPVAAQARKERDHMRDVLGAYAASLGPAHRAIFERYHLIDLAYRVVGVGSVGTRCLVALFLGDGDDDPLFLQIKEANRSVLEPFTRPCPYPNQAERVVQGQRSLQAASDLLLGWTQQDGRDYYVRQLKDMKGSFDIEGMDPQTLLEFAALCGKTLAQAHARSGDFCQIAGYLGKSDAFDGALAAFAHDYADQTERDHAALKRAIRAGRLPAEPGTGATLKRP